MFEDIERELLLDRIPKNENLMDEIFRFDPNNLEATSSVTISKYTIGLAQYIIYLNSSINKKRVLFMQKKRYLETKVAQSEVKSRTKADRLRKVVDEDPELMVVESELNKLEDALTLLDGSVTYFVELVNAFKRELTRREKEVELARYERRF